MVLYLIRHGKINRDGSHSDYYYKLTEEGIDEVKEMALFLKSNYHDDSKKNIIFSSNTLRTIETSIILSETINEKIKIVKDAHEMSMGYNDCKDKSLWKYVLENGKFTNREGFTNLEKFRTRHYLGESPYDTYKRLSILKNMIILSNCDNLYVVGHGTTLRLLLMQLSNKSVDWYYDEAIPNNASVRKLVLQNNTVISDKYIWR